MASGLTAAAAGAVSVMRPTVTRPPCAGQSVALAAPVQDLEQAQEQPGRALVVREHVHVALGREAREQDRLLPAVLADAARAVSRAQAARLPAAHRQLEGRVV